MYACYVTGFKIFVEIHYGGIFKIKRRKKKYVGGKVHVIKDFDKDEWSWFEIRYHLKQSGIVEDFIVYQKLPERNLDSGLVLIDCDLAALESMKYLN